MNKCTFVKVPYAVKDYYFDWTDWLAEGEAIESFTIVADEGITVDSSSSDGIKVTVYLSGGTAVNHYDVTCNIVTDAPTPRKESWTMDIYVKNTMP